MGKKNKAKKKNLQPSINNDQLGENMYEEFSDMLEYESVKSSQSKNKSKKKS
jgi:hypothetical protein